MPIPSILECGSNEDVQSCWQDDPDFFACPGDVSVRSRGRPQAFAQNGLSPYAEGPSGQWNEEKQGPRPKNSYSNSNRRHNNNYNNNYRNRDYRYRHNNHRNRHRNNNAGAAILGGILGLGAGLAIGNSAPRSTGRYPAWSRGWYRDCDRRYRSFNPRTGYYMGYDGRRHFCR
ncbi:BA14K family protein [Breoghania sp. L-A4]|uniref:BA14K family protein n=1 Tax=Breoghania sp. L-A4 TaxID=2304600 RepID=UPI000E35C0B4|nr:BA14K family protein [Breoghania sp. L-A4]